MTELQQMIYIHGCKQLSWIRLLLSHHEIAAFLMLPRMPKPVKQTYSPSKADMVFCCGAALRAKGANAGALSHTIHTVC